MRMRTLVPIAVASIAIAVVAGIATGRAIWPQPAVTTPVIAPLPPLYVAEDKRDLGEVWETSDAVLTIPISNSTDKPIEILDFETSCDCGEISPRRLTVPANGTANVTVKMDLTRRTIQQIGLDRRRFTHSFKPVTSSPKHDPLEVQWIVRSGAVFNHCAIHFWATSPREKAQATRSLKIAARTNILKIKARALSDRFSASIRQVSEGNWEVEVIPASPLLPGTWQSEVAIEWLQADAFRGHSKVTVTGRNVAGATRVFE